MGTMFYSLGIFLNRCLDELNLSAPDMVRQIHEEYVKAGAEILEINAFGATRVRLARRTTTTQNGGRELTPVRPDFGDQRHNMAGRWRAGRGRRAIISAETAQPLN
jgi:S-methylmethionine-dependent homocysteine/selenocysteine methylase